MTLKELLSHFKNPKIWVCLHTSTFGTCGKVRNIERELANSEIMDMKISEWTYTNSLNIYM